MSTFPDSFNNQSTEQAEHAHRLRRAVLPQPTPLTDELPAAITKAASKQTFYTIRYLVDRERRVAAYRAYAYFRWVDDCLDQTLTDKLARNAFIARQHSLVNACYAGDWPQGTCAEEHIVVDLIRNDPDQLSGLHTYIREMLAVMAFDADRRGRLITADELADYSLHLATAVTEALHYFIGHFIGHSDSDESPPHPDRYLAVTAAHITHMLRDTCEDIAAGYFNIPRDYLDAAGIDPGNLSNAHYRAWVKSRVELARTYFEAGKRYLKQVKSLRCRLAGYAYIARFEVILSALERDGYLIRLAYPERKSLPTLATMVWSVGLDALGVAGVGKP